MKLHVLTAVSRPWNLNVVAGSLSTALARAPDLDLTWHLRFDLQREHVGGQGLKNEMLDQITDGWVWVLDDDTLVHECLFETLLRIVQQKPKVQAIVVSQRRNDGRVLRATPGNAVVGGIDAGQVVMKRELVADARIPETYAGDGIWLQALLTGAPDVYFEPSVLSLHNVLSGLEVSEPVARMSS